MIGRFDMAFLCLKLLLLKLELVRVEQYTRLLMQYKVIQGIAVDLAIFSLHLSAAALVLGAMLFLSAILTMRNPGQFFYGMPLFV
jgi:hypothetical protein